MGFWNDLREVPEHLQPSVVEPTTDTVYLWADGGGTLYIESSDYPLVVGGVEVAIGSSTFVQDAEQWPCWLDNSAGVHYISRSHWDDLTDEPEIRVVATYRQGLLQVSAPPLSHGSARDYIGSSYSDEETHSVS